MKEVYCCVTQTYHSLLLLQWTKVLCTPELGRPQLQEREMKEVERGEEEKEDREKT